MLGGGRFKKKKKTTQKQPTCNYGDRMEMACEQEEEWLCLTKKKKRETEFFCTNTRDSSSRKERDTRSWKGILVSYFSSWQSRWNWHSTMRQTLSLFFFSFFSLFLCCGQDRWQARTIFRGPLVLIVQCSYWNLYTRQSRILGVQKKKSLMVD